VTRKEKKQIRLQITKLLDTHCSSCKERNERRNSLCLTACPIGKQMRQLSSMLEQDRISKIEGTKRTGRWTDEEELYLWHHQHILTIDQLAEKLNRDKKSIYNKLWRLKKKGGIQHVS
jgi:hypothetical protein